MAIVTSIEKRAMLAAFKEKTTPTGFLGSWFQTSPRDLFKSTKCVIDIKRNKELIAIDVVRGTGGRNNNNKRFTTKEYTPPMYDEFTAYNEEELNNRMPGQNEYEQMEDQAQFMSIVVDDWIQIKNKILRSIEYQAANCLVTGQVPLVNADTLDYKQKATHNFAASPVWSNASGVPLTNIATACDLNRKDGKIAIGEFIAIMGAGAFTNFLERIDGSGGVLDMIHADLGRIVMPTMNTEGAVYHGTIAAGPYRVQVWTYPQYYDVPVGFGLANEGTLVPYIPTDKVVIIPPAKAIDLRLVYGGIPILVNKTDPRMQSLGVTSMPTNIRTDFHPYSYVDDKAVCVQTGIKSAPLCIATEIDGWTVIKTEG